MALGGVRHCRPNSEASPRVEMSNFLLLCNVSVFEGQEVSRLSRMERSVLQCRLNLLFSCLVNSRHISCAFNSNCHPNLVVLMLEQMDVQLCCLQIEKKGRRHLPTPKEAEHSHVDAPGLHTFQWWLKHWHTPDITNLLVHQIMPLFSVLVSFTHAGQILPN